ncbi:MAG TPA: threonine/serine exporter family protein [Ruminiclostridium sp.]
MLKQTILAFFGSIFPVILFNIDRKKVFWAGLSGVVGWVVYSLIYYSTNSPAMPSFFGAFAVGIYSEAMARKFKTPAFVFLIPGIFPLVPGITAYNTLRFIVENNISEAFNKGIQTVVVGGDIAFGVMLSTAIFKFISKIRSKSRSS